MEVRISSIEILEPRIAPATLVNPTTVTYTDVDGDTVTVKISKGSFDLVTSFEFVTAGKGEQLKALHLNNEFQGANLTITAVAKGGGDGFANVGYIDATQVDGGDSIDLGKVLIDGDLGRIRAGDPETNTPALKSLTVHSFGRFGLLTQGNTGDLKSMIYGEIGTLKVITDFKDAQLRVEGDFMAAQNKLANGRIATLQIGGSLIGGTANYSGYISTSGDIGSINIGKDVIGGTGDISGGVDATYSGAEIGSVTIGGSLIGGNGNYSGQIAAYTIKNVKMGGSMFGGTGSASGSLQSSLGTIESVNIRGSLVGGSGDYSGSIRVDEAGTIKIGQDVRGAKGLYSAAIQVSGTIGKLAIGGSLVGNSGISSGSLDVNEKVGSLTIGGSVIGAAGSRSGSAYVDGEVGSLRLGGSLIGGGGDYTGWLSFTKSAGTVTIGGDIVGNNNHDTGELSLAGAGKVTVKGSILGGSANLSGVIDSTDPIKALAIGGSIVGGSVSGSASAFGTGFVRVERVETFTIGGSVIAGVDTSSGTLEDSGSIRINESIGSLSVRGSIVGNVSNPVLITTFSQETPGAAEDVSLGKLTVGGHVEYARILAGFEQNGGSNPDAFNGNASIGTVKVGGDWIASSLVAGVKNLGLDNMPAGLPDNMNFGDFRDTSAGDSGDGLIARIAKIQIGGKVVGSTASNDHFGFSAQQIGAVKIGGVSYARTVGLDSPVELSLTTGDVTIREVA